MTTEAAGDDRRPGVEFECDSCLNEPATVAIVDFYGKIRDHACDLCKRFYIRTAVPL